MFILYYNQSYTVRGNMSDLPDGVNKNSYQPINPESFMKNQQYQGNVDGSNLSMGIMAGLAAAVVGAVAWAAVTYYTGYKTGLLAIGVGFLVGFSVRQFGKGKDFSFSIAGAILALVGCLLGNIFTLCMYLSEQEGIGVIEVLSTLDLSIMFDMLVTTFDPMDILFYAFAVYEAYKYSVIKEKPIGKISK